MHTFKTFPERDGKGNMVQDVSKNEIFLELQVWQGHCEHSANTWTIQIHERHSQITIVSGEVKLHNTAQTHWRLPFTFSFFCREISDCQWLYLSQPWKHSLKSSLSGRSHEHNGIYAQSVLCTVSTNLRNSVPLTSGLFINQNFILLSWPLSSYPNKNIIIIL